MHATGKNRLLFILQSKINVLRLLVSIYRSADFSNFPSFADYADLGMNQQVRESSESSENSRKRSQDKRNTTCYRGGKFRAKNGSIDIEIGINKYRRCKRNISILGSKKRL